MKKFPFRLKSRNVVVENAMCRCGHLQTEHDRTFTKLNNGKSVQEYGEGPCCVEHCVCDHFRWVSWVTKADVPQEKTSLSSH